MVTHDSGQRLADNQRLSRIEKFALFKTDVCRQQIGKPEQDISVGNFQIANKAVHGAVLDQGAGNNGAATQRFQPGQQTLLLFAKMGKQLGLKHLACLIAGGIDLELVAAFGRTTPMQRQFKRGVVFAGEILQFRATFHVGQCCPDTNISL